MWDFEHGEFARQLSHDFEIAYTVPSLCAEALRKGEADIGIIPAITYQTIPDLLMIPDVAIAARGPVRSILLVSKVPIAKIKSVALDTSSRTSVALLQILFRKNWLEGSPSSRRRAVPKFSPQEPSLEAMLKSNDAALLIGDPALTVDRSKYQVVDLAEAWYLHTGKPFVFAFWAISARAAESAMGADLPQIFNDSRDHGLQNVLHLAEQWAPRVGISEESVVRYLTSDIHYVLDPECEAGLYRFYDLAIEAGLIREVRPVKRLEGARRLVPPGMPELDAL